MKARARPREQPPKKEKEEMKNYNKDGDDGMAWQGELVKIKGHIEIIHTYIRVYMTNFRNKSTGKFNWLDRMLQRLK